MTVPVKFEKVLDLPQKLEANTFYLKKGLSGEAEIYLTSLDAKISNVGNSDFVKRVIAQTIVEDPEIIFKESIGSVSWIISHNMNKYPTVSITDSGGNQIFGDVTNPDKNTTIINFGRPTTGEARLI